MSLPAGCDVIVSAPRHLLIEQEFKPVAEIRWEPGGHSIESILKAVRKSTSKLSHDTLCEIPLPDAFKCLTDDRHAKGLSWTGEKKLDCLFWKCKRTDTTLICQIFRQNKVTPSSLVDFLISIKFTEPENGNQIWSVQDFKLTIPADFQLKDYTFAPGLTRLAFHNHDMNVNICRLAPARERLAAHPLKEILHTLQGKVKTTDVLENTPDVYESGNFPTLWQQLRVRLQRNKPFQWGKIWHLEKHNRILAITAESNRPLELDTVHKISAQYEII